MYPHPYLREKLDRLTETEQISTVPGIDRNTSTPLLTGRQRSSTANDNPPYLGGDRLWS